MVASGLCAALHARGLDVRPFKVGPDYLDPTWLGRAAGRPARNLDAWMTGEEGMRQSFSRGAKGGGLAIVEGVMGLFDGRSPTAIEGSSAAVARLLVAPVVLVVDAAGMARTAAAVVSGLVNFDPGVHVAGVIFNRVGGDGHTALLRDAIASASVFHGSPPVVLGGLPRRDDLTLPERHLGLLAADDAVDAGRFAALAAWVEAHLDLDAFLRLAVPVPVTEAASWRPSPDVRIGVPNDVAFHFYYPDNLELLEAAGAEIVPFSTLTDSRVPDVDGLYIGGGYPEACAASLAANNGMRSSIRAFPGPIYAECGGLMYLGDTLDDYPMCGVLPLSTRMTSGLRSFGYRDVVSTAPTLLGPAGTRWRGHEFHHSEVVESGLPPVLRTTGWGGRGMDGWSRGNVLATYVHEHFGSNPELAFAFVDACRRARRHAETEGALVPLDNGGRGP